MARIYIQSSPSVLSSTASMAGGATLSGSVACRGYSRIKGMLITSSSLAATSGLSIYQSLDLGTNWDWVTLATVSTCSGSVLSASLFGNAVKVLVTVGATDAAVFRTKWWLMPL